MPDEPKPKIARKSRLTGGRLEKAALRRPSPGAALDASRLRRTAPPSKPKRRAAPPPRKAAAPRQPAAAPGQPAAPPAAPGNNPLSALPFPNPGDRIRAEDFKTLSQSLLLVRDAFRLSGMLFGRAFPEAALALEAQQYVVTRVMTVFGTEIENPDSRSLENRKVIGVTPLNLGEPEVVVVVTEAMETRRLAPDLIGLTYNEASERLRGVLGDIPAPGSPMRMPDLMGSTLMEARQALGVDDE